MSEYCLYISIEGDFIEWSTFGLIRWKPTLEIEAESPYAYVGRLLKFTAPSVDEIMSEVQGAEDKIATNKSDYHLIVFGNSLMPKSLKDLTMEQVFKKYGDTVLAKLLIKWM